MEAKKMFTGQLQTVYEAFYISPKTMKEVDAETGIMRENICRYCATLRKSGLLFLVKKRQCRVTKHQLVSTWTTNPELNPTRNQLLLF